MKGKEHYRTLIAESLAGKVDVHDGTAGNEIILELKPSALGELPGLCGLLSQSLHARFVSMFASDERPHAQGLSVRYVFSVATDDLFLLLCVPVDPRHMEIPSISTVIEAADWYEREIKDMFGIIAFPNIHRLATHPDWPEDIHPMGRDFDAGRTVDRVEGEFDLRTIEGEGVFEIPVGPVHAGIIEPGHFRFSVAGEPIIHLDVQLYYVHRGIEKIAEGTPAARGVFLAECISGDSSVAHSIAYCHALERLTGTVVPGKALVTRTMLLELERITNHIGDIGAIMLDVGFSVGAALAAQLRERFMHHNEALTGSRLLRGVVTPGGIKREIGDTREKRILLRELILAGRSELAKITELISSTASLLDRLESTGRLRLTDAFRLKIVGVAGRASGIDRDLRRDHPHCAYAHVAFKPVVRQEGDVLARLLVRADEVAGAFSIIEQLLDQSSDEPAKAPVLPSSLLKGALGYAEGWRGEIFHWLMTDAEGRIVRWHITDPSFHNWRGLKVAVLDNIVPDFPVINKSFNLSYAGNDR